MPSQRGFLDPEMGKAEVASGVLKVVGGEGGYETWEKKNHNLTNCKEGLNTCDLVPPTFELHDKRSLMCWFGEDHVSCGV